MYNIPYRVKLKVANIKIHIMQMTSVIVTAIYNTKYSYAKLQREIIQH